MHFITILKSVSESYYISSECIKKLCTGIYYHGKNMLMRNGFNGGTWTFNLLYNSKECFSSHTRDDIFVWNFDVFSSFSSHYLTYTIFNQSYGNSVEYIFHVLWQLTSLAYRYYMYTYIQMSSWLFTLFHWYHVKCCTPYVNTLWDFILSFIIKYVFKEN